MKRFIKASEIKEYAVLITFCGFIGVEEEYIEYADNEDEAVEAAIEEAKQDLEVRNVVNNGDGTYDVEINFASYVGADNTYVVDAEDETDAELVALEEAYMDLECNDVSTASEDDDDDAEDVETE